MFGSQEGAMSLLADFLHPAADTSRKKK